MLYSLNTIINIKYYKIICISKIIINFLICLQFLFNLKMFSQVELIANLSYINLIVDMYFMDGLIQYFQRITYELWNLSNNYYIPPNMRAIFWEMINWTNAVFRVKDYQVALDLLRKFGPEWMAMKKQYEYDLMFLYKLDENTLRMVDNVPYNSIFNPYVINKEFYVPTTLYEDIFIG